MSSAVSLHVPATNLSLPELHQFWLGFGLMCVGHMSWGSVARGGLSQTLPAHPRPDGLVSAGGLLVLLLRTKSRPWPGCSNGHGCRVLRIETLYLCDCDRPLGRAHPGSPPPVPARSDAQA